MLFIYTDFSKVFDKIEYSILTCKLAEAGIQGTIIQNF